MGSIGVKANRPIPIATASAASPAQATTQAGYALVLSPRGNGGTPKV
jgi:hypothetical protein